MAPVNGGSRRDRRIAGNSGLQTVLRGGRPFVLPFSGGGDSLSRRNHGGVSGHCHRLATAARPGPERAEAVLRIVEGDALDRTGQDLPVRRSRLPAGVGLHDVPSAGAVSSSLTN